MINQNNNIHKTAILEDGCIIGNNVTIGAFCIIGKNVKIGNNTTIASHTIIEGNTTIGENNKIFSHCSLGTIPQDLKFSKEDEKKVELIIGNNNTIREHALFNTGTIGGGNKTIIGDNNLFMGYTHIAHDCIIKNNSIFANVATLAGHVEIEDNVVVGGLTPIHQFCKIGRFAMIAGGSVVTQDIPPFCLAQGNRTTLRGLNLTGLRRNLENRDDINEIKKAYTNIFESDNSIIDSAKNLIDKINNKYVLELANFVINSKRGISFNRKKSK